MLGHPLHERVEILTFRLVSRRIEIGRDDAEIGSHLVSVMMRQLAAGHTGGVTGDVKRVGGSTGL